MAAKGEKGGPGILYPAKMSPSRKTSTGNGDMQEFRKYGTYDPLCRKDTFLKKIY